MVLEFLKMEINSDRFSDKILKILEELKLDVSIIDNGDLLNPHENEIRNKILGDFRGYKRNKELFERFPSEITWYWAELGKEDLEKIKYTNYSYWNELSNHTGSPLESSKTILSKKEIYEVSNNGFLEATEYL